MPPLSIFIIALLLVEDVGSLCVNRIAPSICSNLALSLVDAINSPRHKIRAEPILRLSSNDDSIPRLHADLNSLVRWIEREGGLVNAEVVQAREGWSLAARSSSSKPIAEGTDILLIPKSLCISSNPNSMPVSLIDNAATLMESLHETHWRARLAIALLSERVKPNSFFSPYLRNLPFEFWGMPVFFSASEFRLMQDPYLMQQTRDRCRFLGEFTDTVLAPFRKQSPHLDPFSGNSADVNAFGWGFATASSRALRHVSGAVFSSSSPYSSSFSSSGGVYGLPEASAESEAFSPSRDGRLTLRNPVMVPGIDIAQHSFNPACEVLDLGSNYAMRTVREVQPGEALTISYGPFDNDELFADFGFSVDNNPYDTVVFQCHEDAISAARAVMGQVPGHASMRMKPSNQLLRQEEHRQGSGVLAPLSLPQRLRHVNKKSTQLQSNHLINTGSAGSTKEHASKLAPPAAEAEEEEKNCEDAAREQLVDRRQLLSVRSLAGSTAAEREAKAAESSWVSLLRSLVSPTSALAISSDASSAGGAKITNDKSDREGGLLSPWKAIGRASAGAGAAVGGTSPFSPSTTTGNDRYNDSKTTSGNVRFSLQETTTATVAAAEAAATEGGKAVEGVSDGGGMVISEQWLHKWQVVWLKTMGWKFASSPSPSSSPVASLSGAGVTSLQGLGMALGLEPTAAKGVRPTEQSLMLLLEHHPDEPTSNSFRTRDARGEDEGQKTRVFQRKQQQQSQIEAYLRQKNVFSIRNVQRHFNPPSVAGPVSSSLPVSVTLPTQLLAVLRVLYADSEHSDLLVHGYDPFTLQQTGSLLSAEKEAHVLRTAIGVCALVMRSFGTDILEDLRILQGLDKRSAGDQVEEEENEENLTFDDAVRREISDSLCGILSLDPTGRVIDIDNLVTGIAKNPQIGLKQLHELREQQQEGCELVTVAEARTESISPTAMRMQRAREDTDKSVVCAATDVVMTSEKTEISQMGEISSGSSISTGALIDKASVKERGEGMENTSVSGADHFPGSPSESGRHALASVARGTTIGEDVSDSYASAASDVKAQTEPDRLEKSSTEISSTTLGSMGSSDPTDAQGGGWSPSLVSSSVTIAGTIIDPDSPSPVLPIAAAVAATSDDCGKEQEKVSEIERSMVKGDILSAESTVDTGRADQERKAVDSGKDRDSDGDGDGDEAVTEAVQSLEDIIRDQIIVHGKSTDSFASAAITAADSTNSSDCNSRKGYKDSSIGFESPESVAMCEEHRILEMIVGFSNLDTGEQGMGSRKWYGVADLFTKLSPTLGAHLPVNVREACKYRIRKKRLLARAIIQLANQYQLLRYSHAASNPGNSGAAIIPSLEYTLFPAAAAADELSFYAQNPGQAFSLAKMPEVIAATAHPSVSKAGAEAGNGDDVEDRNSSSSGVSADAGRGLSQGERVRKVLEEAKKNQQIEKNDLVDRSVQLSEKWAGKDVPL